MTSKRARGRKAAWLAGACAGALLPAAALAQDGDETARDAAIPIADRFARRGGAQGVRVGSALFFPTVSVDVGYASNAVPGAQGEDEESEAALVAVSAGVAGQVRVGRVDTALSLGANRRRFVDFEDEDAYAVTGAVNASAAPTDRLELEAELSAEAGREPRIALETPVGIARTVGYDTVDADLSARFKGAAAQVTLSAGWGERNFDDTEAVPGFGGVDGEVDQDVRDLTRTTLGARLSGKLFPAGDAFVQLRRRENDFPVGFAGGPFAGLSRDFAADTVQVGIAFDADRPLRGEVALGLQRTSFDADPIADVEGFSAQAGLEWLVTPVSTMRLDAGTAFVAAGFTGATGADEDRLSLGLDTELRRDILLTGSLRYLRRGYEGIDRDDAQWELGAQGRYRLTDRLELTAGLSRIERESDGADGVLDYMAHTLQVGLRLGL